MLFLFRSFRSYPAALQLTLIILFSNLQVANSQIIWNHARCTQYERQLREAKTEALAMATHGYTRAYKLQNSGQILVT
jgi:hypothetical protein